ncbi:Lipoyl(octanoyl) transferase [Zostera marina]|uniref:Lipoyl(Octanoyl) transferase n=1 Tax=Zostera marina TaxID=29655 RepID=A0A0K9P7X6_ZOSMR|nr:Lipoyl(octanoyl) transferase [Zostera marina]
MGFPHLDVKIKWPNDIYLNGLKIAGISCNSKYISGIFNVSSGVGLNLDNVEPTTCLNAVLRKLISTQHKIKREEFLSAFFNKFEDYFETFLRQV